MTDKVVKCAALLAILLTIRAYLAPEPAVANEVTAIGLKANRIERPPAPAAILEIGGFVGSRLRANVNGYLKVFDVDHYVRLVEQKQHRDWKWVGEHPGKWLESAALAAEQTGDDVLRAKAGKILARLVAAQEPGGYLGVTDPTVRTDELPLRGMDAYELYFMLHGLLTTYDLWGEDSALQAARNLGDYFVAKIGPGKAEFWPRPKGQTIAGHNVHYSLEGTLLANPMLRLYQATGDRKYLEWSRWVIDNIDRWSGHNTFSKLDKVADGTLGVHELQPRVHAHTLHMNLLGFLRLYQITGDETLLSKVRGAWHDIAGRQMYVTGGVSVSEYYRSGHNLPLTGEVVETCAMMSWIELSQYLLELTGDTVYADAIEKLLWNHLFAAQTIEGEVFRYHTPLNGTKPAGYFHGPDCCTASGPRIAAKIPSLIYAVGENALYVNQFVESKAEIRLNSRNIVTLIQETDYPSDGKIIISVKPQKEEQFALNVRLPAWCMEPSLSVNRKAVGGLKAGTYAKLNRRWKNGDHVTLSVPMQTQWVKRSHTTESLWALKRGPVVYAVDTVWWDEPLVKALGSVPKDLSKAIKVVIEESAQSTDLKPAEVPAGVLGPAFPVSIVLLNGKRAEVEALPFANVGRWYSDEERKPGHDERRYAYAVWLDGVKNIPAFPGAEGAGAVTPGGRGGKVIEVTNLNDSGPGSLREAVETSGPRIVVFRVSGIIKLQKVLAISNPFITIAGQTAPGDGICISGQTTEINTHDVVLRYLRFRRGNISDRNDALGGYPVRNIIIDHCSASWGLDENLSLYRYMKKMPDGSEKKSPTENLTIQWCISSEALDLNNHAFGATWGGRNGSFHHNLFACNTGRNPSIGWGDHFDFRNNVLFNWRHRTVDGGDASSMVNIVANYYKSGPAVNEGASRYRICRPQHLDMYSEAHRDGKWYVADNFVVGNHKVTADNWAGGVQFDDVESDDQVRALIEKVRASAPVRSVPITQQSAEQAYELVLALAGATLPKRDAVDARVIESVRTGRPAFGNGIIDTPADVGGWPEYKSVPAPADTDHDGMPDEWEEKFGLNPNDPSDGPADKDDDGYTNVEEWLNSTNPTQYVDYQPAVVLIQVDATQRGKPLKHVWQYYGYDECNYTTTPDCKALMRTVAQINPEPVYLRQHFLLNSGDGVASPKWSSTNVYTEDSSGNPVYDWRIMDGIMDAVTASGCRPLVEIGLMPKDLSVRPEPYRPPKPFGPNEGMGVFFPPKDYDKWAELIRQWARHTKDRYKDVEETWLWELWNEPDIFYFQGTYEDYEKLFEYTEQALHQVMPEAVLGGPHVAGVGKFMGKFLTHCAREKNSLTGKIGTRLDYIGFHAKGGIDFKDGHVEMNMRGQLQKHQRGFAMVASFPEFRNTPIIIGEADPDGAAAMPASQSPSRGYRNVPAYGAYVAAMMKYSLDLAEREKVNLKGVLTWAFMFDGMPWFEGYRTLATNGIHKPVLNAFKMLGQLKGNELPLASDGAVGLDAILKASVRARPDINGMAVADDKSVKILIWNYHDFLIPAEPASIQLKVKLPPDFGPKAQVIHYRIDDTHSNSYTKWLELGSPQNPSPAILAKLKAAMELEMLGPAKLIDVTNQEATLGFDLPRFGLSLIILSK